MIQRLERESADSSPLLTALQEPVRTAVLVCAVPHWLDDTLGLQLIREFCRPGQSEIRILHSIKSLPLVYPHEGRTWRLAPSVRKTSNEQIQADPEFFLRLCGVLVDALEGRRNSEKDPNSSRARQLLWALAYHEVPRDRNRALDWLDELIAYADGINSLADFKAAADLVEERREWLRDSVVEAEYFRGRFAYASHDYAAAEKAFRQVWEQGRVPRRRAFAGHLLAVILRRRGGRRAVEEASRILHEALEIAQRMGDDYGESHILTSLSATLRNQGSRSALQKARTLANRSAFLARKFGHPRHLLVSHTEFARVLIRQGGWDNLKQAGLLLSACDPYLDWSELGVEASYVYGAYAHIAWVQGDLELAEDYLRESLELQPDRAETLTQYARLLQDSAPARAEGYFLRALELSPHKLHTQLGYAGLLRRLGKYSAAAERYRAVLDRDPENVGALFGLAAVSEATGEAAAAGVLLRRVLEIDPENLRAINRYERLLRQEGDVRGAELYRARARYFRAESADAATVARYATQLRKHGELEDAEKHFRRALELDAGNVRTRMGYAKLLRQLDDLEGARVQYEAVLEVEPENVRALVASASLLRQAGNLAGAEERYRRALDLERANEWAVDGYARLLREMGRREEAEAEHRRLRLLQEVRRNPEEVGALARYASLLRDRGELDEAEALYRRALGLDPESELTHRAYAKLLRARDRSKAALEHEHRASYLAQLRVEPADAGTAARYATQLHMHGELEEAVKHFRRALELDAGNVRTRMGYAKLLRQLDDLEGARMQYEAVLEVEPENVRALVASASLLRQVGDLAGAEERYRRALDLEPENEWALDGHARLLREAGRHEEAEAERRRMRLLQEVRRNPEEVGALARYATFLRDHGQIEEAETFYRRALQLDANHLRTLRSYARLLQESGDREGAALYQKRAALVSRLEADPEDALARSVYAALLRSQGELDEAEKHFRRALELDADNVRTRISYAKLLRQLDDLDGARVQYEAVLEVEPENVRALVAYASLLRQAGDLAGAEERYRHALDLEPENEWAMIGLARIVREYGEEDEDELVRLSSRYVLQLRAESGEMAGLVALASMLRSGGELETAEDLYRHALELEPENELALRGYAALMRERGQAARADFLFKRAWFVRKIRERPRDVGFLARYGLLLWKHNNLAGALQRYTEALAVEPDSVPILTAQATVLGQIGRVEEADQQFRRALELEPQNRRAREAYLRFLMESGRFETAIEYYRQAVKAAPEDIRMLTGLAHALEQAQRRDEAVACWRRILAIYPESPPARLNLARLLAGPDRERLAEVRQLVAGLPETRELAALLERVKQLERNLRIREADEKPTTARDWYDHGRSLERQWELEAAVEAYRMALALQPGYDTAKYRLGSTLMRMNRFEEGIAYLQQAVAGSQRDVDTLASLGLAYHRTGRSEEAEPYFREALRQDRHGRNANLKNWFGRWLMEHRRDYTEAERYLREAVEMAPKRPAFLTDLARVIITAGWWDRFAEAQSLLRRAQAHASPEFEWPSKLLVDAKLGSMLAKHVDLEKLGKVYTAGARFQRSRGPRTDFSPDVSFVRRERLGAMEEVEGFVPGVPDLAVKVISPGQSIGEVEEEVYKWLDAGCQMALVVDPKRRTATVFYRSSSDILHLSETDVVDGVHVVPGWKLPLYVLFD